MVDPLLRLYILNRLFNSLLQPRVRRDAHGGPDAGIRQEEWRHEPVAHETVSCQPATVPRYPCPLAGKHRPADPREDVRGRIHPLGLPEGEAEAAAAAPGKEEGEGQSGGLGSKSDIGRCAPVVGQGGDLIVGEGAAAENLGLEALEVLGDDGRVGLGGVGVEEGEERGRVPVARLENGLDALGGEVGNGVVGVAGIAGPGVVGRGGRAV